MSESPQVPDPLITECWTKRFYAFGTAKLFERRARSLAWRQRVITFLGLASPVLIGAFVAAYSTESQALRSFALPAVGAVSIVQALFSLWSLVAHWDERRAYALIALKNNNRLASDFEQLATASQRRRETEIDRLRFEYSRQDQEDSAQEISDGEKRFGQRSALFQYRSACPACGLVPNSMKPTNCDSCGNF